MAERDGASIRFVTPSAPQRSMAFIGIHPCDLAALSALDGPFSGTGDADVGYEFRRKRLFTVVAQCIQASATCFCDSLGTGPHVTNGCDLAVTELLDGLHRFVVQAFSEAGAEVLERVPFQNASREDLDAVVTLGDATVASMRRTVDLHAAKVALMGAFEHPRWTTASGKCLACGNCTMVCPTCFCNTVEDSSDVTGETAERRRKWDSCFSVKFSYIHGGSVRASVSARYRQRLVHKIVWQEEQFGVPGCVGCGRCITWCPVGIDITKELKAFQEATQ